MQITDVRTFPVDEKRVKAYASIVFDYCFIARDVKIIQGDNKCFVAMPSKRMKDGSFRSTVHPLSNITRQIIEEGVLGAYNLEVGSPQT